MMNRSSRAAATRKAILNAARACFALKGPAATTTREIAQKAGVTQPLVHHYFGSKEALFDAVLDSLVKDYDEVQATQWDLPMGDLRFLTQGLVVLFWWLGENPEAVRLSAWARLEGRVRYGERHMEVFGRVRKRLAFARESGILRADVDVEVIMMMVDSLFKGYWDRRELFEQYPIQHQSLDGRYLAQTLQALIRGLFSPEAARVALEQVALSDDASKEGLPGEERGEA